MKKKGKKKKKQPSNKEIWNKIDGVLILEAVAVLGMLNELSPQQLQEFEKIVNRHKS